MWVWEGFLSDSSMSLGSVKTPFFFILRASISLFSPPPPACSNAITTVVKLCMHERHIYLSIFFFPTLFMVGPIAQRFF